MEIETTLEWFYFADADFDSALILNNAYRKYNAIICFHCQQAVEKYSSREPERQFDAMRFECAAITVNLHRKCSGVPAPICSIIKKASVLSVIFAMGALSQ
jgi:hypothetical protein